MSDVKLFQGDCLEVMQDLIDDDIKVDLVVTSPPYDNLRTYNDSLNWNFDIFKQVANKLYQIVMMLQLMVVKLVQVSDKHYISKR